MFDIRHSMDSGEWYTQPEYVEATREALGGTIDIDPCGSEKSQTIVRATHYLSDAGQIAEWCEYGRSAFANPPGSCRKGMLSYTGCGNLLVNPKTGRAGRCSCALPRKFMEQALRMSRDHFMDIVYLAYNISQLRQLSKLEIDPHLVITIAVPPERLKFINAETMEPGSGSNADSAFVHVTRNPAGLFESSFSKLGCAVYRKL